MPGTLVPAGALPGLQNVPSSQVVLVVMEPGSAWPSWVDGRAGGDTIVVAQARDVPPVELTERVVERLAVLELSGRQATLAVLAVTNWPSEATALARRDIGRALVEHLRQAAPGSLILSHSEQANTEARARLLELAGAIARDGGNRTTSVSVRFHVENKGAATSPAGPPGVPVDT